MVRRKPNKDRNDKKKANDRASAENLAAQIKDSSKDGFNLLFYHSTPPPERHQSTSTDAAAATSTGPSSSQGASSSSTLIPEPSPEPVPASDVQKRYTARGQEVLQPRPLKCTHDSRGKPLVFYEDGDLSDDDLQTMIRDPGTCVIKASEYSRMLLQEMSM